MEQRVPERGTIVSAVAYVENARDWARRLEDDEAASAGVPVEDARSVVARRLGIAPGTLTSLRKNRLKSISAHVYDRLNKAAARALERQLVQLTHELHLIRQQGLDARSDEAAAVVADIHAVRAALGLAPPSDGGGER